MARGGQVHRDGDGDAGSLSWNGSVGTFGVIQSASSPGSGAWPSVSSSRLYKAHTSSGACSRAGFVSPRVGPVRPTRQGIAALA